MNKKIWIVLLMAAMGFSSTVGATCGSTGLIANGSWNFTTDPVRMLTGVVESIIGLCGDGDQKAQLIVTQEKNNQNTSGEGGSAATTDTSRNSVSEAANSTLGSASGSEFSGSAFNYVYSTLLSRGGNVGYDPLKKALAGSSDANTVRQNVRSKILTEFFADPTKREQSTTEYQEKIRTQRGQYVQEAAGRHVTLGYRVKGHIQNDLSVISTVKIKGDGELGDISVDAHTLEQMVKIALVDLALQIEMMEADAIQFMIHQPVILMSETKPEKGN